MSRRSRREVVPVEILIRPEGMSEYMSGTSAWDEKTEEEVQENIDQAVEDAIDLDFASFEEVKQAFSE